MLVFENVSYYVDTPRGCAGKRRALRKGVIRSMSGTMQPGDFVALMGASGAGKTTLLNILSRKITSHEGTILLNSAPATVEVMSNHSCVIPQDDYFFGHLTVEEHLNFQARLRVPMNRKARQERVREVVAHFGLSKSIHSRIGNVEQGTSRGISGGEKKRLSVATDLLTNPGIVFADEPTTGLDAYKAESLIKSLKTLTDNGHIVICTIHQPSSDVFALFNKVMLISEGRQLYFGPRLGALPYFLRLGHPCPPYTNPADFLIELVCVDWDEPDEKLKQLHQWADVWQETKDQFLQEWEDELQHRFLNTFDESMQAIEPAPEKPPSGNQVIFQVPTDHKGNALKVNGIVKFQTVFSRALLVTSRNPSVVRARLIQAVVTAFLGGLVYLRLDTSSWYSKSGAVFFMIINQAFMSTFTALMSFMSEKRVVLREAHDGLYPLGTYFFSKISSDLLFQCHLPILYTAICWFLMGLNDNLLRFLTAAGFNWLTTMACASIGYLIGAIAPTPGVAVALGPVVVLPCLLVSGFILQKSSLPKFWLWLYHASPFVYANSALMRTVFLNEEFELNLITVDPTDFSYRPDGNSVLRGFGLSVDEKRWWVDLFALAVWALGGRIIAGFLFILLNRRPRKS